MKTKTKSTHKKQRVYFVLANYFWAWGLPWALVDTPGSSSLGKKSSCKPHFVMKCKTKGLKEISDKNASVIFCFIFMKLYETEKQLSSMFLLGIMKFF